MLNLTCQLQVKTRRYHYTPIRMVKSTMLTAPDAEEDAEQRKLLLFVGGNANL